VESAAHNRLLVMRLIYSSFPSWKQVPKCGCAWIAFHMVGSF